MSGQPLRVLITGASSGIGEALAEAYARRGARVFAAGRSLDKLQLLAARLAPATVIPLIMDVTDEASVAAAVSQMAADAGALDLVIHAAGDCRYVDDGALNAGVMRAMLDTNVMGAVNLLVATRPLLAAGRAPWIYLVSSAAIHFPFPRAEAYGASKAALSYLARSLRTDWEPHGICVGLIEPGFVDTPLTRRNDFAMPTLLPLADAAARILRGIDQKQYEIRFPLRLMAMLRWLQHLPLTVQRAVARRMRR